MVAQPLKNKNKTNKQTKSVILFSINPIEKKSEGYALLLKKFLFHLSKTKDTRSIVIAGSSRASIVCFVCLFCFGALFEERATESESFDWNAKRPRRPSALADEFQCGFDASLLSLFFFL